jgi:molybdopterin molybdotransferase
VAELLELAEAQARLIALAPEMRVVSGPVEPGATRYLAHDLVAMRTSPEADLSAMDGYAIAGEGPWRLVGEARAGVPFAGSLAPGECTRLSTGAHLPAGATGVLIRENALLEDERVALAPGAPSPAPMQHVRRRGGDFAKRDVLLPAGTAIGPAQLALALAAGHDALAHRAGPALALLESGDELAAQPSDARPGRIPATNGAMLERMVAPYAGSLHRPPPVADDRGALAEALAACEEADVIVTSGGASVGEHDLVQAALIEWGAQIAFWKVAVKPGKPLMVATREGARGQRQVVLGLPGNPVSSFVTGFLFALPLLRACLGAAAPFERPVQLKAGEDLPGAGDRREFLRAVSDGAVVRLAGAQESSALRSLALANALIERPAGAPPVKRGERIAVYNLRNG